MRRGTRLENRTLRGKQRGERLVISVHHCLLFTTTLPFFLMTPENSQSYQIFDGRERTVFEPGSAVKQELQKQHRHLWQLLLRHPDFLNLYYEQVIQGYVPGKNFITHAKRHREAGSLLQLDLHHAFESTPKGKVIKALLNLGAEPEMVAFLETNAFIQDFLPPGYPTSPLLFNAVLIPMDKRLFDYARSQEMRYSRLADDLAFSTLKENHFIPQEQIDQIMAIIKDKGYQPHKLKVGHPWSQPVEICGASLYQGRVTLPTKTLRRLRGQIHRELILQPEPNLARVWGLLGHVKSVRGRLPNSFKRYEEMAKKLRNFKTSF